MCFRTLTINHRYERSNSFEYYEYETRSDEIGPHRRVTARLQVFDVLNHTGRSPE